MSKETGFRRLEQNLADMVKESQIKLGYSYSVLQLFYPLSSLNHTLQTELSPEEMQTYLVEAADYMKPRMGQLAFSRKGTNFTLIVPAEGVKYVHEEVPTSEFLTELIQTTARHGCTLADAETLFLRYSEHVVKKTMDNGEFDLLLYFEDGEPDDYLYCFRQEGEHVIYHRFQKEDYEEFGF